MSCTIVVGAQWGDEGKGKIVDSLSAAADVVARWQGGPNAGHSVIHRGETLVLHLVPSGILHPGCRCLIGNGVVVDLVRLREEVDMLEARGIPVREQLGVSATAHLILPYHRIVEAWAEKGHGAIGTTGRGIGFAYRDKIARTGLRVADLYDRDEFIDRAHRVLHRLQCEFGEAREALGAMSGESVHDELARLADWLAPMVTDVSRELFDAVKAGRRVLLEGAQGTLLDVDHGTYPFVTSSNASAAGATAGVGLGPVAVNDVIGITKAYTTRVGNGPFPTEMPVAEAARLREAGEEYGATTGRPRRCGWLDLPALEYAVRVNGLTQLVVTKLDVLDEFDEILVAESYEVDGAPVRRYPVTAREFGSVRPVWRRFSGWKAPTSGARTWSDLPAAAREYLEWIERRAGVPISRVSVGAGREAEVTRS